MKKEWARVLGSTLSIAMIATSFAGMAPANTMTTEAADKGVQAQLYVSTNGNDKNDGTKKHPFATVERARKAVDKINDDMTGDIIVNIGAGEYYVDDTVKFSEADSGTNGYQVIYRSEDGIGKAELNGGVLVKDWQETTKADMKMGLDESLVGKVYKTQLDPKKFDFNALYVNDEKATMARTRNYKHDERFPAQRGEYMYSAGGGMRDLIWKNGDLDQKAIDGMVAAQERGEEEIAQLYVWDGGDWDWFTNTLPINGIDASQRKVWATEYPDQPERNRTKYPIQSGARYYLQGNLAFLDIEGEYHYNKTTGELYYYPKKGEEDLNAQSVLVPTVQEIFRFEGSDKPKIKDWGNEPDMNKQVSNITIDGLVMKNTEYTNYFTSGWNYSDAGGGIWKHAPEAEGSTNPSYDEQTDRTEYKVGAITMINTNHLTVQNTQIHNTGLWAIAMFKDNTYHTIKNCDFGYNGYGAITIDGGYPGVGKYCNNMTVENVRIHDIGQNIGHAAGLTVMSCSDSNFRNMEIYNSPRRAIMLSGGPKRDDTDANLDQITDMYATRNHFEYINVYNCEQDSGEDSAVYVCMTYRGNWIKEKYGDKVLKTDEEGRQYVDVSWDGVDRHNYFNQMLIDNVISNPSMRDKNTVHGMDLCMGICGSVLSNIQGTNNQSCTLRIFEEGYDKQFIDNVNNNYKSNKYYDMFDVSKMEYDKIGLTDEFPFPQEYVQYPEQEVPKDIYFSDDFESGKVDATKWLAEAGNSTVSWAYMSEGPCKGQYSLSLDGNRNDDAVVLSRPFEQNLNKIVEVKYFDKRQDYAGSDVNEEDVPVDITPDHWVRVDDGKNVKAIGANGDVSKDYYLYQDGDKVVQTKVQRKAGWHTFKFDYTSGTDVKMYIDGEEVATLPADSFNYLGMGDWTGNGGAAYYDQVVIYGGKPADPVKPLPELFNIPGKIEAESYMNMSGIKEEDCTDAEGGKNLTDIETEDWMEYNTKVEKSGAHGVEFRINVPEGKTAKIAVQSDGETIKEFSFASTNGEWKTVSGQVSLKSGLQKIKVVAKTSGWKLNWMEFTYLGQEVPCKIEAEAYQEQFGTQTESISEGGMGVAYIDDDDWMEYKVVVNEPGVYSVKYRVSVNAAEGAVEFLANGESLKTTILPGSGGWQNWTDVTDTIEFKEAGVHTIRLHVVKGGWNLNYFEISKEEEQEKPVPPIVEGELFTEDFEGEDPTVFETSKDVIKQEVVTEDNNKVLYIKSPDGTAYLAGGEDWSNYVFECKVKIADWKGNAEGPKPWDNMAAAWYINPNAKYDRYSLKYNREKEQFLLYRRSGGDTDMSSAKAPENFAGSWHDYKVVIDNGLITTYVDGEKVFEHEDTSLSSGTIGFDGINVEYCVDDIKVYRQKSTTPSASVESGNFTEPFNVKLTAAEGATIVYTLDGSEPVGNGKVYDRYKGINIAETTTLKFAAVENGKTYSDVVTCEYTFEQEETVDKTELEKLYDECKDMEQGDYTNGSWAAFEEARDAAASVIAKEDVAQDEVDAALAALKEAKAGLIKKGNKALLQKTYNYAMKLNTDSVTDSAKKVFEDAMTNAKAVLDHADATQEEINKAWDNLLEGIWGLGIVKGDTTMLELLVERAEVMEQNHEQYVQDKWDCLVTALDVAKEILENSGDATPDIVEKATDDLLNAILEQRYKANKDNLKDLIDKANGLDLSKYTKESVGALKAALKAADAVMADDSLSIDDQAKVNKTAEALDAAIKGLKLASNGGNGSDEEENVPEQPDAPTKPDKDAPKTGDNMSIIPIVVVLIAAVAVIARVVIVRKKYKR